MHKYIPQTKFAFRGSYFFCIVIPLPVRILGHRKPRYLSPAANNTDFQNNDFHNNDFHNNDVHNTDIHNHDFHHNDFRNKDLHNTDFHYNEFHNKKSATMLPHQ